MPYNPNTAPVQPEAGAEVERKPRKPAESLEVTPEQKAKLAKLRKKEEAESQEKVSTIQAGLSLEQLQRKMGIKHLTDPEAMLHAAVLDRQVTPAKLMAVKDYLEAANQSLIQSLSSELGHDVRVQTQRRIESNFNIISKVEDALNRIEAEGVANKPEDASRLLNRELMRDFDMEQGAADAIMNMESDVRNLSAEQDALEKKIAELTGGMTPGEYMSKLSRGGMPMLAHRFESWFAKISGSENQALLVEKWRENNHRLAQLESNLENMRPKKVEERPMYTPAPAAEVVEEIQTLGEEDIIKAPRPMTREEMAQPGVMEEQTRKARKLVEAQLKKLEARKAQVDSELAEIEPQLKEYLAKLTQKVTKPEAQAYNALRKRRDALQAESDDIATKAAKLMNRMPATKVESVPEIKDEEIIEAEPVSGVRRKERATPPPVAESPAIKARKADEERMRREAEEAFEARKKQEEQMEQEAFNQRVVWAENLLPGGQARALNEDVLGQMGLNWEKASPEQRQQSVDYVFKAAEVQAAKNSGNARAEAKLNAELKAMEVKLGLISSPYNEPRGRAGVGVTLETARGEQRRTAGRAAGTLEAGAERAKARRARVEKPVIEAITTEQAEAEEAVEEAIKNYEARKKAEEEEKMTAGAKAAKEVVAKAREMTALPEDVMVTAEVGKRMMENMSIERAAADVPQAEQLWNLVNEKLSKKSSAAKKLNELKDGTETNPATLYVMAMARYLEAVNEPAPLAVIQAFEKRVTDANKALGIAGEAVVQAAMAERGKKAAKAPGRNVKGATRQEETRRGGRVL
ncbi:hypothetical protein HZC53_02480 [Candidatus Uhrbacteria bacterium]|nr:hypothetical protein [Candidatus Uhrbacteria bacterium]